MKIFRSFLGLPLAGSVVVFILATLAVGFPPRKAQAQVPTYGTNTVAIPFSTVVHSTASNMVVVIDCSKQSSVALALTAGSTSSTSSTNLFYFVHSIDGTTNVGQVESTGFSVTVISKGATPQTVITNIPSNGAGYLIGLYITNSGSGGDGNAFQINYPNKVSSP